MIVRKFAKCAKCYLTQSRREAESAEKAGKIQERKMEKMKEIRKIIACDICGSEIKRPLIPWLSSGANLRFWKRSYIGRPGEHFEFDVCVKCWQTMFDACRKSGKYADLPSPDVGDIIAEMERLGEEQIAQERRAFKSDCVGLILLNFAKRLRAALPLTMNHENSNNLTP